MRILHVTEAAEYGVLRHIALVSEEMSRLGHQCRILMYGSRIDANAAMPCPAIVHPQSGNRLRNLLDSISVIRQTCSEFKPDIIHLHAFAAGVAGRLAFKNCVYSPHAFAVHKSISLPVRMAVIFMERLLRPRTGAYALVSASEHDAALSMGLPLSKLHIFSNGLPEGFPGTLYTRDESRRKLNERYPGIFSWHGKVGIFPGRLYLQKHPEAVIAALSSLGAAAPRVVFCGDGPLLGSLKNCSLSSVFFTGRIPELWRYLRAFDFAIMPSLYEGHSYSYLECLAAGLPIATTNANVCLGDEIPEGVLLFNPCNVEELAAAIRQASQLPHLTRDAGAYSLQRQVMCLLKLYSEIR